MDTDYIKDKLRMLEIIRDNMIEFVRERKTSFGIMVDSDTYALAYQKEVIAWKKIVSEIENKLSENNS